MIKSQGTSKAGEMDWIKLAIEFHDAYERFAPEMGYETREDTKVFDPTSPNGELMTKVVKLVVGKAIQQAIAQERERIVKKLEEIRRDAKAEYYNDLTAEDREHVVLEEVEHDVNKHNAVLDKVINIITNNHE